MTRYCPASAKHFFDPDGLDGSGDVSRSIDGSGKVLNDFCAVVHVQLGSSFGVHLRHDQLLMQIFASELSPGEFFIIVAAAST